MTEKRYKKRKEQSEEKAGKEIRSLEETINC